MLLEPLPYRVYLKGSREGLAIRERRRSRPEPSVRYETLGTGIYPVKAGMKWGSSEHLIWLAEIGWGEERAYKERVARDRADAIWSQVVLIARGE